MPWTIYWDNGIDCGTWGHLLFDSEQEAKEYADFVSEEYIREEIWDEDGFAEPYWLDSDREVEHSLSYFDRYIAGDR